MAKYKYLTEKITFGVRTEKVREQIDEIINKRASEGWRLCKIEFCEWLGAAFIIFEKEADILD